MRLLQETVPASEEDEIELSRDEIELRFRVRDAEFKTLLQGKVTPELEAESRKRVCNGWHAKERGFGVADRIGVCSCCAKDRREWYERGYREPTDHRAWYQERQRLMAPIIASVVAKSS